MALGGSSFGARSQGGVQALCGSGRVNAGTQYGSLTSNPTLDSMGATDGEMIWKAPRAGILRNLIVQVRDALGVGTSLVATVRRATALGAMADTAMAATIPGASPALAEASYTTPLNVAAGDRLQMKIVYNAAGANGCWWSLEYVPA